MREFWLIARYEFSRTIRNRSLLFFTIAMPLLIVVISFVPIVVRMVQGVRTIGYLDQSAFLSEPIMPSEEKLSVSWRRFDNELSGRHALAQEEISTLWIISPDYLETGYLRVVVEADIDSESISQPTWLPKRPHPCPLPTLGEGENLIKMLTKNVFFCQ